MTDAVSTPMNAPTAAPTAAASMTTALDTTAAKTTADTTTADTTTVVKEARAQPPVRVRPVATVALVAIVLLAAALPALVNAYVVGIASTAIVLATLAISTHLLAGVAGLPSLGQAAYLCVGGYTAALLGVRAGVTSAPVQLVAAILAAALAGAVTAPLVLRARGAAHLMVTLAIAELVRTVASKWVGLTGGDDGLLAPPVTLPGLTLREAAFAYWYLLVCFLLLVAGVALLLRSRLALVLRAAADHEPRLTALGHPVSGTLLAGHITAAAIAGAGGAFMVAANRYLSPTHFSLDTSALALLAAAIGAGYGLRGAIAGAVFIVAVRDLIGAETGGHALGLLGLAFLAVAYRPAIAARLREWPALAHVRDRLGRTRRRR